MKRHLCVAVGLLALGWMGTVARADDKSEITALYAKFNTALKSKNFDAMMKMAAPDFKMKEMGQVMDGRTVIAQMKQQLGGATFKKQVMKPESIKLSGKNALVMTSYESVMQMKGPDGKPHTMAESGKSKDTLVKMKDGWKFKMVEMVSQKMSMDGKPFNPMAGGSGPPRR